MQYQLPTAWLLLATDDEVNQIAYNVQKISVSQCTSAYHCQIENSSPVEVDIAASSVGRGGGGGLQPSHWHVNQNAELEKYLVFSTSETVLCTGMD